MDGLIRQGRDLRADFFRGLALWAIFVNHTPGNWAGYLTTRNYVLSDASEIFVMLAGYAGGIAYGMVLDRQGWVFAASRVMGRVFTLYVAHIFLLVVFTAQVGFSAAALDSAAYLDELHLDPFAQEPYRALLEALLLRYQPNFLDILPLYIVLLVIFAIAMPLMRWPWAMLGASALLYVLVRTTGYNLPAWRSTSGWFFNPFGWQVLFFVGCAMGYRPPGGGPLTIPWRRWIAALCWLQLVLSMACVLATNWFWDMAEDVLPSGLLTFIAGIDKTALHPMRLGTVVAMTYLIAHGVPATAAWLHARWAGPFVLMGQQGLPVFCAGIALSFLGRIALEQADGWPMQLLVNAAGLLLLLALAVAMAWYSGQKRVPRRDETKSLPAGAATDRG